MPNFPRRGVSLLNDDHTPMDFVVGVLERFFGMSTDEAITQMYRIHNEGKAICGTYSHEEAEKKVAVSSRLLPSTNTRSSAFCNTLISDDPRA